MTRPSFVSNFIKPRRQRALALARSTAFSTDECEQLLMHTDVSGADPQMIVAQAQREGVRLLAVLVRAPAT